MSLAGIPSDCSKGTARAPDSRGPTSLTAGPIGKAANLVAAVGSVAAAGLVAVTDGNRASAVAWGAASGSALLDPKRPDIQVPKVRVSGLPAAGTTPAAGTAPDANALEVSGATLLGAAK